MVVPGSDDNSASTHRRAIADRPNATRRQSWIAGRDSRAPQDRPTHADSSPGLEPGTLLAHRYRIERRLGTGGMGEVFAARDLELAIPVALKVLHFGLAQDPTALRSLKREVLLARSIAHPNVCRVYDLGRHDSEDGQVVWFLTMEILAGETLRARLRRHGALPTAEARLWLAQMTAGLAAAHRSGVMHRDFKSSNVMLVGPAGNERAVVTDFGLARLAGSMSVWSSSIAGETDQPTGIEGTLEYMAPEQLRGEEAAPAADIYALGVVLFEMVTGRLPFIGRTRLEGAQRRLVEDPPSPRHLVPELEADWEAVILRCLARDPRNRFAHPEDVAAALLHPSSRTSSGPLLHRLPAERDLFVGRRSEIDELRKQWRSGERLVTLIGAGGMGKTRLAVRCGWETLKEWPGGVWFTDLTDVRGVNGVASALAASLGVSLGSGDPIPQLGHSIAARDRCLIILDNFESVIDHTGDTVARWLERAAVASFLITSRERLNIAGEIVHPVEALSSEAAAELFVERARRHHPGFDPGGPDADAVREIVRMADGIPLAIELAAARVRVMGVAQLADRMQERFRLLRSAGSGRHSSLEAAIDGSWEGLHEWEQAAWCQCAVFEGGFTLDAAEAVLDLRPWPEAPWVVDIVQSLVDKSLVRALEPEIRTSGSRMPDVRFSMYVSLQEYARARLGAEHTGSWSGARAEEAAEVRHGRWYAQFGSQTAIESFDLPGGVDRRWLALDIENLTAACRRAIRRGDGTTAVAAYRAAAGVFEHRGPFEAAVKLGTEILRTVPLERENQAALLMSLGLMGRVIGGAKDAMRHAGEALDIYRDLGNRRLEGLALGNLAVLYHTTGLLDEARRCYGEGLAIARQVGNRRSEGSMLGNLGIVLRDLGNMEEGRDNISAAVAIARGIGDRTMEGHLLGNLGVLLIRQGRLEEARDHYERALAIQREVGDRRFEGINLSNLGNLLYSQGRTTEALAHFAAALTIQREVGDRRSEGINRGNQGELLLGLGQVDEAREHFEASLAIAREVGDRVGEGIILGGLSAVELRLGRLPEARDLLVQGETILRETGEQVDLGKLLCSRGLLELDRGNLADAQLILTETEALAEKVGTGPDSEFGRKLDELRAAMLDINRRGEGRQASGSS